MTYAKLLEGIEYTGAAPPGEAVLVTQQSGKVVPGAVFVCVKGRNIDGHTLAQKALDAGAGMIVSQTPQGLANEIVVADTRRALAELAANFFGRPSEQLVMVGVTGTNGKTTVTTVIKQALEQLGCRCGLLGTVHNEIGEIEIPAKYTTPEAWDLHALLAKMLAAGCTHVVMEASSQALVQERLYGIRFALGVFTNLTRDHLDYHGDMETYFDAKKILFAQCDAMLTNMDDTYGLRLLAEAACARRYTYSADNPAADFYAGEAAFSAGGVQFKLTNKGDAYPVTFNMPGRFSVYNALAAAGSLLLLGQNGKKIGAALENCRGVPGRCEVIYNQAFTVLCDYAHTGDAVDKLLGALRPFVKNKLYVVFGCAGRRDPGKRITMSEAAAHYADFVIISSDNPVDEDPQKIAEDSLPPLVSAGVAHCIETDRHRAIEQALDMLLPGDMLALVCKGHEDYQVMNGYTLYLNERGVVEGWLQKKGLQ